MRQWHADNKYEVSDQLSIAMSGVIDLDGFQEILRKVQQERDHYRSETARLRTENASLLNEIDVLKARLSDREGERVVQEAVGAQRKACINYIKNKVGVEDTAHASSAEGFIDSPSRDEPSPSARDSDHEVVDELSGEAIDINEFVRSGHLVQWDEESTALESTTEIDCASGSYPTAVPQPEWYEDSNVRPGTISVYSEESPLYPVRPHLLMSPMFSDF
ncbi:hypothetical protein BDN67DRAFT_651367 [Paxillus ammoniavirescens]|nr:hypothetical protein BDN67DRAFT_651367 [Paxillus ammoniavirescens]